MFLLGVPRSWPQQSVPGGEKAAGDQRVVLRIGEEKFTAADVEAILQALPPQSRTYYATQGRRVLPQYLIRMKVLSAEARKQDLGERPEVRQAIQIATESILADAAQKRIVESIPVPEEALADLYQQRKAQFEQVRIRRLLMRTETSILGQSLSPPRPPLAPAEARKKLEDLRRQILEGADFAAVAKSQSDDLETARAGGDLGFVDGQKVVPPIAQAAFSLAPGQVSEIIPTPYGLEIIKVEEKRTRPLAEVRTLLEAQYRQGKIEAAIQQLQKQYAVEIDSGFFSSGQKPQAPEIKPLTSR